MIRSFVAIELPPAVREEIGRLQGILAGTGADVKWVRPGSVHLTVKFLGDVPEETIAPLADAVDRAVCGVEPFTAAVAGTGVFPGRKRPRVVWLGLSGNLDILAGLQRIVETAVAGFGFTPDDRPFKPHLTLGRVRSPRGGNQLLEALDALRPQPFSWTVEDMVLFRSELKPSGAVYTPLARMPLRPSSATKRE